MYSYSLSECNNPVWSALGPVYLTAGQGENTMGNFYIGSGTAEGQKPSAHRVVQSARNQLRGGGLRCCFQARSMNEDWKLVTSLIVEDYVETGYLWKPEWQCSCCKDPSVAFLVMRNKLFLWTRALQDLFFPKSAQRQLQLNFQHLKLSRAWILFFMLSNPAHYRAIEGRSVGKWFFRNWHYPRS